MALCPICQEFDIRSLLLLSLEAKEDRGEDYFHTHLSKSVKYHDDIFALRAAARNNCELCAIVWHGFEENGKRAGAKWSEKELANFYNGEIYIGTDGWWEGSKPQVIITVHRSGEPTEIQLCVLDAFAKRGKLSCTISVGTA